MTNDEINAKIAEIKGYTRADVVYFDNDKKEFFDPDDGKARENWTIVQHWLDPITHRTGALPDWAGNLDVAITLMINDEYLHRLDKVFVATLWRGVCGNEMFEYTDKSPSRSVCLAWLKSQGIEVNE